VPIQEHLPPVMPHTMVTRSIRKFLRSRGFVITRYPLAQQAPFDIRCSGNDPRSIAYLDGPVLIDAPLNLGRGLHNYPLHRNGPHPFVRSTYAMLHSDRRAPDEQREVIQRLLDAYYRYVQPSSFGEWMGLTSSQPHLHEMLPWAGPFPWETRSVEETRRDRAAVARRESARGGAEMTIAAGWQFVGPIAPEKVSLEVERLRRLSLSMTENGYRRSDARTGDILGMVLWWPGRQEDSWRWIVHDGHHRAAVASAVGLDTIPLRVVRLVRRDEAAAWPNVLSGLFSLEAALEIFDGQFSDDMPPVTGPWVDFLRRTRPPGYLQCPTSRLMPAS
jgi:hypothetical protein